jgi:chromosome segregation ATPase
MEIAIPELTIEHIGLLALALVVGIVLGWFFRADRAGKEKIAVNAGWQDQLESQQAEQDRLAEQNKSLMEQISQYQASHQDSINRAKELSDSVRESLDRRKELEQQVNDFRSKLEATVAQRDKLKETIEKQETQDKTSASGLKEKDDKIFHLSRELTSWQSRVPPLVEKFQERDKRARELEEELANAMARIESFEELARTNQTRIEPVDAGNLPEGLDASNEPHSDTAAHAFPELQDQIDDTVDADVAAAEEPAEEESAEGDAAEEGAAEGDAAEEEAAT